MAKLSSVQQFGENFLAVMQNERKLRQEQEQFRQQMSQSMRQFDLLNSLRQKELDLDKQRFGMELSEPYETKTGEVFGRKEGMVDFTSPLYSPPMEVEPIEPLTQSRLKPIMGGLIEEQFQTTPEGDVITGYENLFSPDRSGNGSGLGTTTKPHLDIADKIKGLSEAENIFRDKDADENIRKKAFDDIKAFSEGMISDAQLELERDIIWDDKKFGVSFEESIKNINNFRVSQGKPPLNEQEFDVLRRYRNARFPESYSK